MNCLQLEAMPSLVEEAQDFVVACALELGLDTAEEFHIRLMLEELLINICSYAYPDGTGKMNICVGTAEDMSGRLHILLQDYGMEFNPLLAEEPDLHGTVESRPLGGLGIHFVRQLTSDMRYERINESNILHLYMKIQNNGK